MRLFFPIAVFLATTLLSSCANLSKNAVKSGRLVLVGGVGPQGAWKEHWNFQRLTWMHELSMWLDLSLGEITPESPFFAWAAEDEKKTIRGCRRFRMAIMYALDSRKLSEKDMLHQLDRQGHRQVLVPRLAANIRLHPDFDRLGLDRHHVYGLCQAGPDAPITLDFPGFAPVGPS